MMKNNPIKDRFGKLTAGRPGGQIELLAPAGSIEAGYAALHYGADAVYLGLSSFSARAAAVNFSIDELADITGYAHSLPKRRKIFIAVNTLVLQKELGELIDLLAVIADIGVDAVIVQDLGVLNILCRYFPQIKIHASTQMAIHNLNGVEAARKMGVARVTLARELSLAEIAEIAAKSGIETEVFIHGALCYSYSGLCLFSSHLYGRSGNRGNCAYPCREWFKPELSADRQNHLEQKGGFIFSMKDLALPDYITELRRAGVTALKIEGRMKSPLYVAAAVNYYRHLIDGRLSPDKERELASDIKTIFSRPWTDLYLETSRKCDVIDAETQGHRGSPAGKVEEIAKNQGGHCLRFKTALPIELHDGLQIDIAGLPRPFGFAVKNINIIGDRLVPGKKRVFTAPAGARVEIQLSRGHPAIPLGAIIYSSSSQKVKQQYDFFKPKPGQFRFRQTADFDVRVEENGFDVIASANVVHGIKVEKGNKVRVEAKKYIEGLFQPADNISQMDAAFKKAFGKLGDTNLKLGKLAVSNPHNLFIPISLLNSIRRDISAALEQEIAELPRKYAAEIKNEIAKKGLSLTEATEFTERGESRADMACKFLRERKIYRPYSFSVLSVSSSESAAADERVRDRLNFKWSLKTDQPHLLAAFGPDDWKDLDEIIIECVPGISSEFIDQLDRLSGNVEKSHLRLALPVIMRRWEIEIFTKTVSDLISKGWGKWQISNLGGWALLNKMTKTEVAPFFARNPCGLPQGEMASLASQGSAQASPEAPPRRAKIQSSQPEALLRRSRLPRGLPRGASLDISADWPVYAMNSPAVLQLKALGMNKFTLSPEDGFENLRELLDEFSADAVVIVYQDTPLMISESCIFASEKCSYSNMCKFRELFFSAPRGEEIRVISRNCRSTVLNKQPFCLSAHLKELANAGAVNFRADFINRGYSEKEMLDIWRRLRSGAQNISGHIGNFKRGFG